MQADGAAVYLWTFVISPMTIEFRLEIINFSISLFKTYAVELGDIATDVPGEYWMEENFLRDLPDKWELSFVLSSDGVPVAYAIASRKGPDWIHLHHFMVHRLWRGHGFGRRMLAELERRVRAVHGRRLTLKTATDAEAAKRFYRRHGFRLTKKGDQTEWYEKTL